MLFVVTPQPINNADLRLAQKSSYLPSLLEDDE
jgi:hypothetical protein